MQIQVLNVSVETKPTAKGSYQQAEVAFKNLTYQGKVEAKKLMSFGANAPAFSVLTKAQAGDVFDIEVVKNDKGYNDWVKCVPGTAGAEVAGATSAATTGYSTPASKPGTTGQVSAPRSNYETAEERARRQVLIVRQSSLSAAVATLTVGAKALKKEDVVALAKEYEAYVFNTGDAPDSTPDFNSPDFIDVPM